MAFITITVTSSYYEVSLQLVGIPADVVAYSLVDGSIVPTTVWMKPNAPTPHQPSWRGGFEILDDFSPPSCSPCPSPTPTTFVLNGNVLGNDEISIPNTYYLVTVIDTRSLENVSQDTYYIVGATYDLDTATPLSVTPIQDLNSLENGNCQSQGPCGWTPQPISQGSTGYTGYTGYTGPSGSGTSGSSYFPAWFFGA